MKKNEYGTLYVVATPIGNLNDMTPRAIQTLKQVRWIAAEDTRHTGRLLQHFGIQTQQFALHDFNESAQIHHMITRLQQAESIAMVCDAGTPLISDAGYKIVNAALENGIQVVPIVGACALIAALSVSGLPTDRFSFEGFLPPKKIQRENVLKTFIEEKRTLIFYEAPHRLIESLKSMQVVFGQTRLVCVARELTKQFETVYRDTISNLIQYFSEHEKECLGEIVLLLEGAGDCISDEKMKQAKKVLGLLLDEMPLKKAVKITEQLVDLPKNQIYEWALEMKN